MKHINQKGNFHYMYLGGSKEDNRRDKRSCIYYSGGYCSYYCRNCSTSIYCKKYTRNNK